MNDQFALRFHPVSHCNKCLSVSLVDQALYIAAL